ncbi:MAG: DUF488 family protein, partial [Pyrinomonadaceae bacterium]
PRPFREARASAPQKALTFTKMLPGSRMPVCQRFVCVSQNVDTRIMLGLLPQNQFGSIPVDMKLARLATIGYEGLDIASFLAVLKANKVTTLIDVRELPLSRKKGFSKWALADAARGVGIAYQHMSALGCPRDIRKDYYEDRNWARYKKRFNTYLWRQEGALNELLALAKRQKCCLVCFEADYQFCHRSLITSALESARQVKVQHLQVKGPMSFGDTALAFA